MDPASPSPPGKLSSQGADSSLSSADGKEQQERGASPWLPEKEEHGKSDPATPRSPVTLGVDPEARLPAHASVAQPPKDQVDAEEEGSQREEATQEPKKEASALKENISDNSEVSLCVPWADASRSLPLLTSAPCLCLSLHLLYGVRPCAGLSVAARTLSSDKYAQTQQAVSLNEPADLLGSET